MFVDVDFLTSVKKKSKLAGDSLRVLSLKEQSGMEFEILRKSELVESN